MTAYFLFSNCVSASLSDSSSPRPNAFPGQLPHLPPPSFCISKTDKKQL